MQKWAVPFASREDACRRVATYGSGVGSVPRTQRPWLLAAVASRLEKRRLEGTRLFEGVALRFPNAVSPANQRGVPGKFSLVSISVD